MDSRSLMIIPPALAIKSMRDNGYRNAAYALAELIDNAVEAGAKLIEVICNEETELVSQRQRSRLNQIAVLDNGKGMSSSLLASALQFGNGSHANEEVTYGIGKFGMGLPNSSISQCTRVDVWTWQRGPQEAYYSYLDINEIISGKFEVPKPLHFNEVNQTKRDDFEFWEDLSAAGYQETGTLVVWSNLDRCNWKTARSLINNSSFLLARTYRRFLHRKDEENIKIRMASYNYSTSKEPSLDEYLKPNDPMYLLPMKEMMGQSVGEPFPVPEGMNPEQSLFQVFDKEHFEVKIQGNGLEKTEKVHVTYSIAESMARDDSTSAQKPGSRPYGKHAAKNLGVSIMRADRELDLDIGWTNPSEPRQRWWGVEIDFPPSLDQIFGVSNNKQYARYFAEIAKKGLATIEEEYESLEEEDNEYEVEGHFLLKVAYHIQKQIRRMDTQLREANQQNKGSKRHESDIYVKTEKLATKITEQRKKEGLQGKSDKEEELPEEQRKKALENSLENSGYTLDTATKIASFTVERKIKYVFTHYNINSLNLFEVRANGGVLNISLNATHPAFKYFLSMLDEREKDPTDIPVGELFERYLRTREGLRLLFISWARMEDEAPTELLRHLLRVRTNWGDISAQFLDNEHELLDEEKGS